MPRYMVERYLPGITAAELDDVSRRLAAASRELAAGGIDVKYFGLTFVPEEESCFCRFESASAGDVHRACRRAGVPFARIVETHDVPTDAGTSTALVQGSYDEP
jgi:Nickel responsive protein SCO4226-like